MGTPYKSAKTSSPPLLSVGMSVMNKPLRRWCMTIWLEKTPDMWDMPQELPEGVRLLAWQHEQAPETGREHFQAYIALSRTMRPKQVMKLLKLNKSCWHIEPANGSEEENLAYCSKDDSRMPGTEPMVLGATGKQGKREDIDRAAAAARAGGLKRVALECPREFIKFHKGFERYLQVLSEEPRDRSIAPKVEVYWGPTGGGKTKMAFDMADASGIPYFSKSVSNKYALSYAASAEHRAGGGTATRARS